MKLQDDPALHLTYCLNIHPGETWGENFAAIRDKALAVKGRVAPDEPFGLGLRLSWHAAQTLSRKEVLADLRRFLDENGLYVFTLNGFPYGEFHGLAVKENVYRPDWSDPRRLAYTNLLADILAELLGEGVTGSISTVPLSYKAWVGGEHDVEVMVSRLAESVSHLAELRRRTGKDIALALEPEPDCLLETTAEAVAFFAGALAEFGAPAAGDEALRHHLGLCVDVCHLAVEFEDPKTSIERLVRSNIAIPKVQLSSALACTPSPAARQRLREFCDPVYLHQVKVKTGRGEIVSCDDLSDALAERIEGGDEEWRVHFHVPLYFAEYGELKSTSALYTPELARLLKSGVTQHLEIETYTFDVLPEAAREPDIVRSIAREYEWVLGYLRGA